MTLLEILAILADVLQLLNYSENKRQSSNDEIMFTLHDQNNTYLSSIDDNIQLLVRTEVGESTQEGYYMKKYMDITKSMVDKACDDLARNGYSDKSWHIFTSGLKLWIKMEEYHKADEEYHADVK